MSHPPEPPSHEATQAFPAGGAPPPPPPDPLDPGPTPASGASWPQDVTRAQPSPVAPGGYDPYAGYGGAPPGAPAAPAGPAPAPAPKERSTGRIALRALVVLFVVAALVGAVSWGFVNRASAERWRDRAEASDEDLTRSLERVEATEAELEEARVRLRELANEKAGAADENRILSEIVAQAPAVTAALSECQAETAALANELIDALGTEDPDLSGLQARTDEVNDICNAALEQAQQLEATIDGLG